MKIYLAFLILKLLFFPYKTNRYISLISINNEVFVNIFIMHIKNKTEESFCIYFFGLFKIFSLFFVLLYDVLLSFVYKNLWIIVKKN